MVRTAQHRLLDVNSASRADLSTSNAIDSASNATNSASLAIHSASDAERSLYKKKNLSKRVGVAGGEESGDLVHKNTSWIKQEVCHALTQIPMRLSAHVH